MTALVDHNSLELRADPTYRSTHQLLREAIKVAAASGVRVEVATPISIQRPSWTPRLTEAPPPTPRSTAWRTAKHKVPRYRLLPRHCRAQAESETITSAARSRRGEQFWNPTP
jgi:hypothetical protein